MSGYSLEEAQRLVDQLQPRDQILLLAYLASRIAQSVPVILQAAPGSPATEDAWETFFQLGDELAIDDQADGETLTQAVLAMRR